MGAEDCRVFRLSTRLENVAARMLQLPNRHRQHEQSSRERKGPDQPEHEAVELEADETVDQALDDDGADGAGSSCHAEQRGHRISVASCP